MKDNSHKTAITRKKLSRPVDHLKTAIKGNVLDFGCGKGSDADLLGADKYDIHYFPDKPTKLYDTVLCIYVLNTVGFPDTVLKIACEHLKPGGVIIVATRTVKEVEKCAKRGNWTVHKNGYLTGRKTFQRGLSSADLMEMFDLKEFFFKHSNNKSHPYTFLIAERRGE